MQLIRNIRHAVLAGAGVLCCLFIAAPAMAQPGAPSGACCVTAAGAVTCSVVTHRACNRVHGRYQGNNIACGPSNTCPPKGACCFTNGRCSVTFAPRCRTEGGTYQTDGSTCRPTNPCTQPIRGACCITELNRAFCVVVTAARCTGAQGTYQGNNVACTATPPTCPQPIVGACCIAATTTHGAFCRVGTAAACTTAGGTYGGDASTCRSANCPTSCACDWDRNGFLNNGDWFAFMNDWLAGNGDFNGDGTTDRQDVLDFQSCYNAAPAGCVRSGHGGT